jgi:hypothetical protein
MMTPRHLASLWPRRFFADRRGTSAIEFAILLPLMLVMYFGSIQITDAISADRQVTQVASTVAEIASQYTQVSPSDVSNILSAASRRAVAIFADERDRHADKRHDRQQRQRDGRLEFVRQWHRANRQRHQSHSGGAVGPQYLGDLGRSDLQL